MARTEAKEELVSLRIDRVPGDDDPHVFVGLNGKNYLIPKGKRVEVPKAVAEEYYRGLAAHGYSQEHIEDMIAENRQKEKESEAAAAAEASK